MRGECPTTVVGWQCAEEGYGCVAPPPRPHLPAASTQKGALNFLFPVTDDSLLNNTRPTFSLYPSHCAAADHALIPLDLLSALHTTRVGQIHRPDINSELTVSLIVDRLQGKISLNLQPKAAEQQYQRRKGVYTP